MKVKALCPPSYKYIIIWQLRFKVAEPCQSSIGFRINLLGKDRYTMLALGINW